MTSVAGEPIRLVCLDAWEQVAELGPDWEDLAFRVTDASIYQTYQWNACWWRSFGGPHRPCVIACYRGARLVGVAPLMVRQRANARPIEICLIGTMDYASDYADFLVDPAHPEVLQQLLEKTLGLLGAAPRIRLSQIRAQSDNAARIRNGLRAAGVRFIEEPGLKAPTRILGDADADRRIVNKAGLRRSQNALRRCGDLSYRKCAEAGAVLGYMDDFFGQHVERRGQSRSPSQFLAPEQRSFFLELVRELLPRGWLRFDVLELDGRPVAFHFGFEFRERFYWYKPAFDVGMSRYSPGTVLLKYMLEDAIDRKLEEFDFTVGSESFKYRFANLERQNLTFAVLPGLTGYLLHRATMMLRGMLSKSLRLGRRVWRR